jgi:hypothetical protein
MEILKNLANSDVFVIIGLISTLISLSGIVYIAYLVIIGVLPILYRLGRGLADREIYVFSETEYADIEKLLINSKLFKKKNIKQILRADMDDAKNKSIYLVHWEDFENKIDEILSIKMSHTALIIYAKPQAISPANMEKITCKENAVVVNSKGRLLNDILTSLMTTAYQ